MIQLPGFTWFGHNRANIHRNARAGSGGVGLFINDNLLVDFNVSVLDASCEGILLLSLCHKQDSVNILPCVCYLPPENFSRMFDVSNFYDTLISLIYQYKDSGTFYICGDFNSRCGEYDDFIRGVDCVTDRDIIDFSFNKYGELLLDFLVNANMCMLNGRNNKVHDFTSISVKGNAVVDYCFVSQNEFDLFSEFSVKRVTDLINSCGVISSVASSALPDHSLLMWSIKLEYGFTSSQFPESSHITKFDVTNVPNDFMLDAETLYNVNQAIDKLERGFQTQSDLDDVYNDWCCIVKSSMYNNLTSRVIISGLNNKKRRPGKPWWSEKLTDLWNTVCLAEKTWLSCKEKRVKNELKSLYVAKRKIFDREVQRAKRSHWYSLQSQLLDECAVDNSRFWKSIGKIGVNCSKNTEIPMEVVMPDGSISSDVRLV